MIPTCKPKALFSSLLPRLALLGALAATPSLAGFTINATFDSSISDPGNPNSAAIEDAINQTIAIYEAVLSTPITVSIKFTTMNTGLGQSEWDGDYIPYSSYLAALVSHATSADDATALASLPSGLLNPANSSDVIVLKSPNARALGFDVPPYVNGFDGIISLNTSIMNLTRSSIDPNKFDIYAVTAHEINEVLGLGSGLDFPRGWALPEDLFRYTDSGARTFIRTGDNAYFSIDGGTTDLARFNMDPRGGDKGDWWSSGAHTPSVQDAFVTRAATPDLGVELRALDVIGYDLTQAQAEPAAVTPVPEPGTYGLLGAGLLAGLVGFQRRFGRRKQPLL